jgi:uncharacterized membrane protein
MSTQSLTNLNPESIIKPSSGSTLGSTIGSATSSSSVSDLKLLKFNIDIDAIILFIVTLLVFVVIDMLFIYTVSGPMFQQMVPEIQGSPLTLKIFPVFLLYLIMSIALYYFVIMPKKSNLSKLDSQDYISALILGLSIFAVFDLTNLAIFENYSPFITVLDISWGSALFAITTLGVSMTQQYVLND